MTWLNTGRILLAVAALGALWSLVKWAFFDGSSNTDSTMFVLITGLLALVLHYVSDERRT